MHKKFHVYFFYLLNKWRMYLEYLTRKKEKGIYLTGNSPGRPILDSDLIGSHRNPIGSHRKPYEFIGSHWILLFFVGFRVTDSHRIETVGKIHRILLTDFLGSYRPETIGSRYYIRQTPPLGSPKFTFLYLYVDFF